MWQSFVIFCARFFFVVCAFFSFRLIIKEMKKSQKSINTRADFLSELQDILPKIFSIEDDIKEQRYKYFIVYFIDSFRSCDLQQELTKLTALYSKKDQWDIRFYLRNNSEVFKSFDIETLKKLEKDAWDTGVFRSLNKYENVQYFDGDFYKPLEKR